MLYPTPEGLVIHRSPTLPHVELKPSRRVAQTAFDRVEETLNHITLTAEELQEVLRNLQTIRTWAGLE